MDVDFLLFNPPKRKVDFMDFWGETVFLPKTQKKGKGEGLLASFLNCYQNSSLSEPSLTVDTVLVDAKGLEVQSELTVSTEKEEECVEKHVPCLYLNSMVGSKYLLIYFHASGEDIKLSHKLLDLLRNLYQVNVLAMEYPGYSIYKGKPSAQTIVKDAHFVYTFATSKLGFQEQNIIVMGRSIGTGVALELLKKAKPGALVLVSPFVSVKSLAKEFVGYLGQLVAKEAFDNSANILGVSCPTFFLHGLKDQTISPENTKHLAKLCHQKHQVVLSPDMTHSNFDFYTDLADPLREFLMAQGFNFYEPHQKGPVIPDSLFQCPQN